MVESDRSDAEKIVRVDDLEFAVSNDIERIVTMFGNITIDYVKNIYQKGFIVKLGSGGMC